MKPGITERKQAEVTDLCRRAGARTPAGQPDTSPKLSTVAQSDSL